MTPPPRGPRPGRNPAQTFRQAGGGRHGGAPPRERGEALPRLRPAPDRALLWGFHAVTEALRSPRRKVSRLYATAAAAERVAALAAARQIAPVVVEAGALDAMLPRDAVHQGLALEALPLEALDLSDLPDEGTLLVLDQVTDPHNVGAMLRTAAAFGVGAVVTTERHAPDVTGVLAKAASGGLEHVPIVVVTNLARALDQLGQRGFFRVGLDSDGAAALETIAVPAPCALVLGAEGKGLRRLTRERCDTVARLDMPGAIRSLNVSNACAVALTILRLRGGA